MNRSKYGKAPQSEHALIDALLEERKGLNKKDPTGYRRITSRINFMRDREGLREKNRSYRRREGLRLSYEKRVGGSERKSRPQSEQEKARKREFHEKNKGSQRHLRQLIERGLLMVYLRMKFIKREEVDFAIRAGMENRGGRDRMFMGGGPKFNGMTGLSTMEFYVHIDDQLKRFGWTWGDWKEKWTMDHVVPVRRFKLPDEMCACWHYSNLRPLAKDKNTRMWQTDWFSPFRRRVGPA
jgi:hypothetical protein